MNLKEFLKNHIEPEAIILLSFVIKKPKEYILAHPEYKISLWQKIKFNFFWKKIQSGVPMAYIIGHKEFFNLDFLVNKYTLIPRPDTEILAEETLKEITDNSLLIDVGTGTGCIPITILKSLTNRQTDLKITTLATDISKRALTMAKKNAKKHDVSIKFLQGDLLSPVFKSLKFFESFQSVIITANLPYLKEEWWKNEPSIQKEPKIALVSDNENGLNIYEQLLTQIVNLKSKIKNQKLMVFWEIDPRQSSAIFPLIQKYLPEASIEIIKDLSGFDRIVKIK